MICVKKTKCLCIFEQNDCKINIKEIRNFTTKEVFNKRFNDYCENNKECNRICPLDIYIGCLVDFLFDEYYVIPKGVKCDE